MDENEASTETTTTINTPDESDSKSNPGDESHVQLQPDSASKSQASSLNSITSSTGSGSVPQISAESQLLKSKRDLESMVLKYARSERENLVNKRKVEELDKKLVRAIKDNEQLANRIKLLTNDKNQLTDTLNAKVAQLTVLEQKNLHLNSVQDTKLKECEERMKTLERSNEELLKQIESYKSKEGELLDFSERLSMKHMLLQTELDEALKKVPSYKEEYEQAVEKNQELLERVKELQDKLDTLHAELEEERKHSAELRASKEENEIKFRNTTDEFQNEIKVMRRKQQTVIKELTRQMKQLQFKPETNSLVGEAITLD